MIDKRNVLNRISALGYALMNGKDIVGAVRDNSEQEQDIIRGVINMVYDSIVYMPVPSCNSCEWRQQPPYDSPPRCRECAIKFDNRWEEKR